MNAASPYWLSVKQGAEQYAADEGDAFGGITIEYQAPQEDTDVSGQVNMVESAIAQGVDGIILAPTNPETLHDVVIEAQDAGIKVICIDSPISPMDADGFYGTDCVNMCSELGKYVAENCIDGSGKYATMVFNMTNSASIDRYNGFTQGIADVYSDMTEVGDPIITNSDIAETTTQVQNVYQANKDDLKLIFGNNDRTTIGVYNGAVEAGIVDDVVICGVDCNLELLTAMRAGHIAALALQMPYNQGYGGAELLAQLCNGEEIEKESDSGCFILTPDNMDSDEAVAAIRQYIDGYEPADSQ